MKKIAYHCPTIELAKEFLEKQEKKGILWGYGEEKPTKWDWKMFWTENECYSIENNRLYRVDINYGYEIIEYKSKKPKVIFNKNTTILLTNGKKFVSKCYKEEFDQEKGILMCLAKSFGYTYQDIKSMVVENIKYVTVVDYEETCSRYKNFILKYFKKYIRYFKMFGTPVNNKRYKLIGKHERFNRILCLIQDVKTKQVFIIWEKGVKYE